MITNNKIIKNKELPAIFAAYWNSTVMQCFASGGLSGKITEVSNLIVRITFDEGKGSSWQIEKCKLELIPLFEISDDHAAEVALLANVAEDHNKKYTGADRDMLIYLGRGIVWFHLCNISPWGDISNPDHPECDTAFTRNMIAGIRLSDSIIIIDYLRARSYDCGYGEIPSLIKVGIAIDKTKIK